MNGLGRSGGKNRIAGRVIQHEASADNPQGTNEPLAGIKLLIFNGKNQYETTTDAKGMYELYGVAAGEYVIRPDIPNYLRLIGVMHYGVVDRSKFRSLTINVEQGGCSGATILLTSKPRPDSKIGQAKVIQANVQ